MVEVVIAIVSIVGVALAIVVANDWWTRRLPAKNTDRHLLSDLNRAQGFLGKLGTTLLLLLFAVLMVPLLWLGLEFVADPVLRQVLTFGLETLVAFYVVLLVYLWWRPPWLARLYTAVESRLVKTAYVGGAIVLVAAAVMLGILVIRSILPA
jgi:hypothetical protein